MIPGIASSNLFVKNRGHGKLLYTYHFFISNRFISNQHSDGKIATQLSGLKPLSLTNNKNYRAKKKGVFPL